MRQLRPGVAWPLLLAFLGIVGAYVALTMTGHDANGLITAVVSLLAAVGIGAHVEARTQQQNVEIGQIKTQTNGVLDKRILDGATTAVENVLSRAGYVIPPEH